MKKLDEEIDWERLVVDDWKFSFVLSVMGMLNRLHMTSNQTNSLEKRFRDYLGKVSDIFSFDKFIFVPSLGMGTPSSPHRITLEFNSPSGKISGDTLSGYLNGTILPIIESKLQIVDDKTKRAKITEFLNIVRSLANYVQLWSSENMTFQRYYDMRRDDHHDEAGQFKTRANEFGSSEQNEELEKQQRVREIIEQIERVEIRRMYEQLETAMDCC